MRLAKSREASASEMWITAIASSYSVALQSPPSLRAKRLSNSGLAEDLGRNPGSVTRDVNKLRQLGLLRLREQVNPGHGLVQIVEPVARRLQMRVAL